MSQPTAPEGASQESLTKRVRSTTRVVSPLKVTRAIARMAAESALTTSEDGVKKSGQFAIPEEDGERK
jgi:hypothetical protein